MNIPLYLKIKIVPHPVFTLNGDNLEGELRILPWQAALGDKVGAPTLDGNIRLTIPPYTKAGKKLRLPRKGLAKKGDGRGDIIFKVVIDLPEAIGPEEKELYQKLAKLQG